MQTPDVRTVILVIAHRNPRHREERSDPRHREERSNPCHREERSDVAISQRRSLCQSERDCRALRARNDSRFATPFGLAMRAGLPRLTGSQ
ncbi:MAG: hypothetical protein U5K38_02515 [Woeseiaceae bacterium]|nr:hypothetical protein [Woeseiaceae bacterium]